MAKKNKYLQLLSRGSTRFLLLALVLLLAYFQTLLMYFWNDDNAVIFKLQNLSEGVGNLGSGIFGMDSPYRMVIFTLIPIYYFFGINATAFFLYGLIFFFIASLGTYFFALTLFRNKEKALASALIFVSSSVGAESLWRVYNSVHTSITLIYILLSGGFYNLFIAQRKPFRKIAFYLLALTFFAAAVQWGYVRAHGIIFVIVALELLFNFNWKYSLLRLAPFLYLFHLWYLQSTISNKHIGILKSRILEDYEFALLLIPLKSLQNALIPDTFALPFWLFLIILLILLVKFRSRIVFLSLIFIISSYLTYYAIYHDAVLNTTHRYLATAIPGVTILVVFVLDKLFRKPKSFYISLVVIIFINLVLINWTHFQILENRSTPTKNFYKDLVKEIPVLNKNSVIYFDVEQTSESIYQSDNFFGVGSMPNETAIAIYYNLDRYDLSLPGTFEELNRLITEKSISKENVYSFFYSSGKGLINTTPLTRNALFETQEYTIKGLTDVNIPSSTPKQLTLTLDLALNKSKPIDRLKDINPENYLNYFSSRDAYYREVEATYSGNWKNHEVGKVIDNNEKTSWMSHRVHWHYHHTDEFVLNLGSVKEVAAIKMTFGPKDKAPTKYLYSCSEDGDKFTSWKEIYFRPAKHADEKLDKLTPRNCRFIKVSFFETEGKDSPEISEIEVIESDFQNLNFKNAHQFELNPFAYLPTGEWDNFFAVNNIIVKVCFITEKYPPTNTASCQNLKVNSNQKEYTLVSPPGGIFIKQIILTPPPGLDAKIIEIKATNIPIERL